MKLCELMAFIQMLAPCELAEDWDNVGLLYGDPEREIDTVVVTLDATYEAIVYAKQQGAQMIVSHHPLIFSPVRAITAPSALYDLTTSGMALFAAHTNLDAAKGGVNDALAAALGLTNVREAFDGIGRVGELPETMTPEAFAALIGDKLDTSVQLRAGTREIRTVAMVGGSGGEYAAKADVDAFLTGEMKHHEWLEVPPALTVAAAGHYATEVVVVEPLCETLSTQFSALRVLPFIGKAPYITRP